MKRPTRYPVQISIAITQRMHDELHALSARGDLSTSALVREAAAAGMAGLVKRLEREGRLAPEGEKHL